VSFSEGLPKLRNSPLAEPLSARIDTVVGDTRNTPCRPSARMPPKARCPALLSATYGKRVALGSLASAMESSLVRISIVSSTRVPV
jgi:hypothetical protein